MGVLEFENSGIDILNSNRSSGRQALTFEAHGRRTTVFGDIHGSTETDGYVIQCDGTSYPRPDEVNAVDLVETPDMPRSDDGTYQINRHFLNCVQESRDTDVNFAEAIGMMEVIEALICGRRLFLTFDDDL